MFIEEYGFVIDIASSVLPGGSELQEKIYFMPPIYTGAEMDAYNGVISLIHNGTTIADVGMVWREDKNDNDNAVIRLDAYYPLNISKERDPKTKTLEMDEDICAVMLEWSRDLAEKNELHTLADALNKLLKAPKYIEGEVENMVTRVPD